MVRNRGVVYAVGITLVLLSAGTAASAQCTLTCPDDITLNTSDPEGVIANYPPPTGMGDCGLIEQVQGLPSGAVFPPGVVMNTFRDTTFNSTCSFLVTVLNPRGAPVLGSGPLGMLAAAFAGLGFWTLRRRAKAVRRGTVTLPV